MWSFLAFGLEGTPSRSADPSEETEVVLVDLPRLLRKLRSGEMKMQAFHVAALWSAAAAIMTRDDASLIELSRALRENVFGRRHKCAGP